jgi:hypothetical protein
MPMTILVCAEAVLGSVNPAASAIKIPKVLRMLSSQIFVLARCPASSSKITPEDPILPDRIGKNNEGICRPGAATGGNGL